MSTLTEIVAFLMIVLIAGGSATAAAPDCQAIMRGISPCLPYLVKNPGREDAPATECCEGLKAVAILPNLKDECECIKATVLLTPVDLPRFAGLAGVCGTTWNIPNISGDMDCSDIE